MSGGGTYGSTAPGGSTAQPYSAFGQTKAMGSPGLDPGMGGSLGNFNPSNPQGGTFDPNNPFPGGSGQFTPASNMGGSFGNFDPSSGYFPTMDQFSQFLQSPYQPYMGMPQQAQQQPTQPQVPYYQSGQQQPMQQSQQPLGADQTFLNGFNQSHGTNYSAMSQLPANDYQSYLQSSGQQQQQGSQQAAPVQQSPYAKVGGEATFAPPAYPSWLYGPTAGAFGGVTRPQGTPQNYGYFPGTGQWGVQPNGTNFRAG